MNVSLEEAFQSLTGFPPMRWQRRLFEQMVRNDLPEACGLPTGLGKTSVIVLWLLALAQQAEDGQVHLPRRLVYVVNRRTIVDQATDTVEGIRDRLLHPEQSDCREYTATLRGLASTLRRLCASELSPLGVSTLRGELADNEEWEADPARAAVIVGTIDMIGSKLLFTGYGDRRYWRAHHAGLIGQDTLIIHDEAHLTPAFGDLLRGVVHEQARSEEPRRVRIMELSATQRTAGERAFELKPDDETDKLTGRRVKDRLDAGKRLFVHECDDTLTGLVEQAKAHRETGAKVLIYTRSPEDVQKVADAIRTDLGESAGERVAVLTGTIRSHERDRLLRENRVFRAFLDADVEVQRSVFLVSTSAGEVGIDIDADHMVCDMTTLDSMIQRFGRVNRRGGRGRTARVDLVSAREGQDGGGSPLKKAVAETSAILRRWVEGCAVGEGLLVSPRNLRDLVERLTPEEREAAFSPKPTIPPLTDILLDNWSMTSVDTMPGRPDVAAYLHGLTTDPPGTFVVWRKEVQLFAGLEPSRETSSQEALRRAWGAFEDTLSDWFAACRIEARERLRDRTNRVRTKLEALLKAHRKTDPNADFPIVLLDGQGRATWSTLSLVSGKPDRKAPDPLQHRTVVLPVEVGGLDEHGMLVGEVDPKKGTRPPDVLDVAEASGQRARAILSHDGTEFWFQEIEGPSATPGSAERDSQDGLGVSADKRRYHSPQDAAVAFARDRRLSVRRLIALEESGEDEEGGGRARYLLLMVPRASDLDDPEQAPFEQTLDEHTRLIAAYADAMARALNLADDLREALVSAAQWHDRGKDRPVWQRFACNRGGTKPLAKSTRYLHGRALGGYRHEFGSLLEAMADRGVGNHVERDLILHLIGAHHGWARPHFQPGALDNQGPVDGSTGDRLPPTSAENRAAVTEVIQRYGRLQQRFGRWGLAWLESILRCADIAASKPATSGDSSLSLPESVREKVTT